MKPENNHINYIELYTHDIAKSKAFYSKAFNWEFTDYGPSYTSFANSGVAGGFELTKEPITQGALVVLYHDNLEHIQSIVERTGGIIIKPIFSFPGGRRFRFKDPTGNELAVWSTT